MKRRVVLKRLTASDLTLFEYHFRTLDAGNQKAINLNADVFIKELYPELPEIGVTQGGKLPLDLFIYGPGLAPELNLQRKIIKHGTYKNWRLDGEFIQDPPGDEDRFRPLQPDDVAVIEFEGHPLPSTARVVLVAAAVLYDERLHQRLAEQLEARSMRSIGLDELGAIIAATDLHAQHPVRILVIDDAIEDAAQGGVAGLRRLRGPGMRRRVSPAELQRAKEAAETSGRLGESLVFAWLSQEQQSDYIQNLVWESQNDATSPYDFSFVESSAEIRVEVKATAGSFDRMIHISASEVRVMAQADPPCRLYRAYEVTPDEGRLRIARETKEIAQRVMEVLQNLPERITVDSVSVDPNLFSFEPEIRIAALDE